MHLRNAAASSLFKKYVMAITGLGLVLFVILHLAGNLVLLTRNAMLYNSYAHALEDKLGPGLEVLEYALYATILVHITLAVRLKIGNRAARGPTGYAMKRSKGGDTPSNLGSRNMIVTGFVLLVFLVIHLKQIQFGPGTEQGYVAMLDGHPARDLYRLVVEIFRSPVNMTFYSAVMLFLGFHLWHGFWSAFQSLGAMNRKFYFPARILGVAIAALLTAGFFILPLWVHFGGDV